MLSIPPKRYLVIFCIFQSFFIIFLNHFKAVAFILFLFQTFTFCIFVYAFFLRFYLFIHERHTERDRDIGRGREWSRHPVGSPIRDSIPGPQDHTLSWRQMLNHWATQGSQDRLALSWISCCSITEHKGKHENHTLLTGHTRGCKMQLKIWGFFKS